MTRNNSKGRAYQKNRNKKQQQPRVHELSNRAPVQKKIGNLLRLSRFTTQKKLLFVLAFFSPRKARTSP
jgi:hypothetical protein